MASSHNPSDHRAGQRVPLEHFARVVVRGGGRWLGLMTNASRSGSYLRMLAHPQLGEEVLIQPVNSVEVMKGVVTRVDDTGIGVEWLAPQVNAVGWLDHRRSTLARLDGEASSAIKPAAH